MEIDLSVACELIPFIMQVSHFSGGRELAHVSGRFYCLICSTVFFLAVRRCDFSRLGELAGHSC